MQYFIKNKIEHNRGSARTIGKGGDAFYLKELQKIIVKYQAHFESIKDQLPKCVRENFVLHDCQVVDAYFDSGDLVIEFNNISGFTNISMLRFVNCPPKNIKQIIHAYWIYDEFHLAEKTKYKVGILLEKGNRRMLEFIVPCNDIVVVRESIEK